MDLESIMLSEISQKGKYHMISLTTHRQRKGRREGGEGGGERKWREREPWNRSALGAPGGRTVEDLWVW